MTTPRGPRDGDEPSGSSGLPPHLDPRGARKGAPPRVTNAYRQAARGGPAPRRPAPPGPPPVVPGTKRGRRSGGQRVARVLSWIALAMAVTVLVGAGGLYLAFNHYVGQISKIDVLPGGPRPAKAPNKAQNFLLVGSDSRNGANGDGTQGSGATYVTGQRSDTVILAHLYGKSDKVEMVSFPRDSWVEIPAFTDPKTHKVTSAHFDKLNAAFSEGGPTLLIQTIEHLSNIRIDHFVQIDFTGFKGMVDKLGGVDVCLTKPAKDSYSGINLPAGTSHISGNVALAFVRQRHGLPNGDIDRIARQQQFIGSLVHKVISAQTLLNPFKLNGFLDVATSSLQVDKGLSGSDIKNLAVRMRNFSSGGVLFTTVPISDIGGRRNGLSVVLLDQAKDGALFTALRADQAPGTTKPAATPVKPTLIVAPSNVRVAVFNGSGINGKGRQAANDLAGVGFSIAGPAQTRGSGATKTVIYYGPTKSDSAKTLQAALPGSVLQADSSLGRTLDLVIGTDYNGAQKVTVTPQATSAPSTSTAAPVRTAANNPCTP
ncbi:MAG: cell envelope-related transcriptional attenuator [Frankiales bacterium]|nr:cell envelope-related transcriptional attenuator [Frankiales bacterium]